MSIRSLTDFMEVSLRSARRLASTATVTGRRGPQVDASVRGADFRWPKLRTFGGHQCGPLMAISADFFVAMDNRDHQWDVVPLSTSIRALAVTEGSTRQKNQEVRSLIFLG